MLVHADPNGAEQRPAAARDGPHGQDGAEQKIHLRPGIDQRQRGVKSGATLTGIV